LKETGLEISQFHGLKEGGNLKLIFNYSSIRQARGNIAGIKKVDSSYHNYIILIYDKNHWIIKKCGFILSKLK